MRPYKLKLPLETINLARSILFDLGLTAFEYVWYSPYNNIYSCRINLGKKGGEFGVNGKGVTREYCLASAYGELLERLQNGLLMTRFPAEIMFNIKKKNGFFFYPDENIKNLDYILSLPKDIKDDLCGIPQLSSYKFFKLCFDELNRNNCQGFTCVPFYNTKDKKIESLPYNLLLNRTGSNGMSAGNSLEESIYQGLTEVMERWGAMEVLYNRLTPPNIPEAILKKYLKQYQMVKEIIDSTGFLVKVKDFSANLGIPVLGLLIIDKENNKYKLNVGCDTSLSVALSRVITEMHQGIESFEHFKKNMLPIPKKDFILKDFEYKKFIHNSKGIFPPELFLENANYKFNINIFQQKDTYIKDINRLIGIFEEHGKTVYIRNNSFTSFNASFIYVSNISTPKRSIIPLANLNYDHYSNSKGTSLFFKLDRCTEEELEYLCNYLDEFPSNELIRKIVNLEFDINSDYCYITKEIFQVMISFKLRQYHNALNYLKIIIDNVNHEAINYYRILSEWIKKIIEKGDMDKAYKDICMNRNNIYLDEIFTEFKNGNVFYGIQIPRCPKCKKCNLLNDCQTAQKMELTEKLFTIYRKNSLNRQCLSKILTTN